MPLYLEDLSPGQRFTSATHALDERQIVAFARVFDPQPFHIDPDAAKGTFFGGLIASGWHTAAVTMRLLVDAFPIAGGLIGRGGTAEWPQPTRPDDVLHLEGEVLTVKPSDKHPDRGTLTARIETRNQRGETVQILTATMLAFRRRP